MRRSLLAFLALAVGASAALLTMLGIAPFRMPTVTPTGPDRSLEATAEPQAGNAEPQLEEDTAAANAKQAAEDHEVMSGSEDESRASADTEQDQQQLQILQDDTKVQLPTDVPPPEKTKILSLRPTQLAVGLQQVRAKEQMILDAELAQRKPKKQAKWLYKRSIPVVLGPGRPGQEAGKGPQKYLIDHHHLASALHNQGFKHCFYQVVSDQQHLPWEAFWKYMQEQHYVWPFSPSGEPLTLEAFVELLPQDIRGLKDDPYRSLAALVRKNGGYDKEWVPFSEFRWANYLRTAVPLASAQDPADPAVVQQGMLLAASPGARHLPGFKAGSAAQG